MGEAAKTSLWRVRFTLPPGHPRGGKPYTTNHQAGVVAGAVEEAIVRVYEEYGPGAVVFSAGHCGAVDLTAGGAKGVAAATTGKDRAASLRALPSGDVVRSFAADFAPAVSCDVLIVLHAAADRIDRDAGTIKALTEACEAAIRELDPAMSRHWIVELRESMIRAVARVKGGAE